MLNDQTVKQNAADPINQTGKSGTENNLAIDQKLVKQVSDLSEKDIAALVKEAKAIKRKQMGELKNKFSKKAGKIVLKHIKDIKAGRFSDSFKKEILTLHEKVFSS